MSPIPTFEIGVWNAWIFMLYLPLHPLIMILIDKLVGVGNITKKMGSVPYNKTEKGIMNSSMVLLVLAFIYSIFLPLKLGTVWLYLGLPIFTLALVMTIIPSINFANTPLDKPVTKGIYRISRNPIYLSGFVLYLGMGLACASWVMMLCGVLWWVMLSIVVPTEERLLLEKYGDTYREYMNRTPRWLGIPKPAEK